MEDDIFLLLDETGEIYGMETDPETGDFYPPVTAAHGKCLDGLDRAFYMCTDKEGLSQYEHMWPNCVKCGKSFGVIPKS